MRVLGNWHNADIDKDAEGHIKDAPERRHDLLSEHLKTVGFWRLRLDPKHNDIILATSTDTEVSQSELH